MQIASILLFISTPTVSVNILSSHHPVKANVVSLKGSTNLEVRGNTLFVNGTKSAKWILDVDSFTIQWGERSRKYPGLLEAKAENGELVLVNKVDEDSYLSSVVGAEMVPKAGIEALKAQAVLCRTFVKTSTRHHNDDWDFCDLTHCQSYLGLESTTQLTTKAVEETRGLVLTYEGNPCEIFYHSSCGGKTADARSIWPDEGASYLVSVRDDYCKNSPDLCWEYRVPADLVASALGLPHVSSLEIVSLAPDTRVLTIRVRGSSSMVFSGWDFRDLLAKSLGWGTLKSSWFDVKKEGGEFVFKGHGLGHGVGLCQWGAAAMAAHGKSYREILSSYYKGTQVSEWH